MKTNAGAPGQTVRVLLRWCVRLLGISVAVAVLAAVVTVAIIPRATHGQAMTVLTGSMTPEIPVGSIVVVRPVDPGSLQAGDVATYQPEPGKASYITHRIIDVDESSTPTTFTFKGDANRGPDLDPVAAGQIRGQVWFHVPYLGTIRDGLHGTGGISLVAMLLLAGYALSQLGTGLRERRQEPRAVPVGLETDRHLVVATLDTRLFAERNALTPTEAAHEWGALLVQEDDDSFRVLLTATDDELAARLEPLRRSRPRRLLVLDGPITLTGPVSVPSANTSQAGRARA